MSERLDAGDFEQHLGQSVAFSADGLSFEADIKQVDRLKQQAGQARQPFSVIFSAVQTQAYAQKIYTMRHPEIGDRMIFLVPIGPDQNGMCYEAVFA